MSLGMMLSKVHTRGQKSVTTSYRFLEDHSSAEFSSNQLQITPAYPEEHNYLDQVRLIRGGAVALQELSLRPMSRMNAKIRGRQ